MPHISKPTPAPLPSVQAQPVAQERTALQKHLDYFDRNGDNALTVGETYEGMRGLGLSSVFSGPASAVINLGLAKKSGGTLFTINLDNAHRGIHGSNTDIYDAEGQFSQAKFDELFARYDSNQDGAMSQEEFVAMRKDKKEDTASALAAKAEFDLLVAVGGVETEIDGQSTKVFSRERLAEFYDGSLFYALEAQNKARTAQQPQSDSLRAWATGSAAGVLTGGLGAGLAGKALSGASLLKGPVLVGSLAGLVGSSSAALLADNTTDGMALGALSGGLTGAVALGKFLGSGYKSAGLGFAIGALAGASGGYLATSKP